MGRRVDGVLFTPQRRLRGAQGDPTSSDRLPCQQGVTRDLGLGTAATQDRLGRSSAVGHRSAFEGTATLRTRPWLATKASHEGRAWT